MPSVSVDQVWGSSAALGKVLAHNGAGRRVATFLCEVLRHDGAGARRGDAGMSTSRFHGRYFSTIKRVERQTAASGLQKDAVQI